MVKILCFQHSGQLLEDAQRDQQTLKVQVEALTSECESLRKSVDDAKNERESEVRHDPSPYSYELDFFLYSRLLPS